METSAILGRIKSVHKSHPSIMELSGKDPKDSDDFGRELRNSSKVSN